MELVLEVTSEERHLLGDSAIKRFQAVGGVIGRDPACDWAIPDQKRHLSGRHAVISCEDDGFHITDISTNGVFVNNQEQPLGRNHTVKLSDSDRLSMGNIEFVVRLQLDPEQHPFKSQSNGEQTNAGLMMPAPGMRRQKTVDPLALFRAANGLEDQGGSNPQDAHQGQINAYSRSEQVVSAPQHRSPEQRAFTPKAMLPEDWLADPVEGQQTNHAKKPVAPPAPKPNKKATRVGPVGKDQALVQAFFKGLGVSPDILQKVDGTQVMEEMGACLKANMQGMVELMQQRAQLKNEFRMDMTLVKTQGNNPLKFSADTKQAMKHLFKPESDSFLSMNQSFAECYTDLKLHQVAVLAGVQSAFHAMFKALSPESIEAKAEQDKSGISMASRSARYWQKYCAYHKELAREDDDYNRLFSEAFVDAYDEKVETVKAAISTVKE